MALLIFLKRPDRAIAIEGDNKTIDKIDFKKVFFLKVQTFEGNTTFIATNNIAYIQEISKEKLIKQKKDFEQKQKQQQKGGNLLTFPNMRFPKNRN